MLFLSTFTVYILPPLVLSGVGAIFGLFIGIAAKYFYVKEDNRIQEVQDMLPGYNCGACGHPGCAGLAKAIVEEGADPKLCKPGKQEMVIEIRKYMAENKGNEND